MTDYGRDTSLGPAGLRPDASTNEGPSLVLEAIWRRLTTDPASLAGRRIYGSRCYDLRALLGAALSDPRIAAEESAMASACRQDERVADAAALLDFAARTRSGTLKIALRLVDGTEIAGIADLATLDLQELTDAFPR